MRPNPSVYARAARAWGTGRSLGGVVLPARVAAARAARHAARLAIGGRVTQTPLKYIWYRKSLME